MTLSLDRASASQPSHVPLYPPSFNFGDSVAYQIRDIVEMGYIVGIIALEGKWFYTVFATVTPLGYSLGEGDHIEEGDLIRCE